MRKKFYLRARYEETPVKYECRQENYEILSFGKQIFEEEYDCFWKDLNNLSMEKDDEINSRSESASGMNAEKIR